MSSYVKPIKVQKRHTHHYRIVNHKRFICFQLVLCFLIVLFITIINDTTQKEIMGQEQMIPAKIKQTTSIKLPKIKKIHEIPVSRGKIKRNVEKTDTPKVHKEAVSVLNTKSSISKEERLLLEQLVEAEAKGESLMGKIAVANVVLNRVKSDDFPNTITKVIMQEKQFSPVANGSINNTPSEDSVFAVRKIIDEEYNVFGPDVLYFCNKEIATNQWIIKNKKVAMTIGNHTFYFK